MILPDKMVISNHSRLSGGHYFFRTNCEQLCGVEENGSGVIFKIPNLNARNSAWQQAYCSIIRYEIRSGSYTIVKSYSLLRAGLGLFISAIDTRLAVQLYAIDTDPVLKEKENPKFNTFKRYFTSDDLQNEV